MPEWQPGAPCVPLVLLCHGRTCPGAEPNSVCGFSEFPLLCGEGGFLGEAVDLGGEKRAPEDESRIN